MARLVIPLVPVAAAEPASGEEPLAAWVAVVQASPDACLVLDARGRVAGVSARAADLLGEPADAMVGRVLVGDVIEVVDFTREAGPGDSYALRIAPLMALTSELPTRGLLRVRHGNGERVTIDAVSAPLHAPGGRLLGSMSFLCAIPKG